MEKDVKDAAPEADNVGPFDGDHSSAIDGGCPDQWPHLHPRAKALMTASGAKRIRYALADRFIVYPGLTGILNRIHWLVLEPRNSRARGELYLGPPGSGKSSISQVIQRAYPISARDEGETPAPKAVAISISGARTITAVLTRLRTAIGVPMGYRNIENLTEILLESLKRANCRLLILDEMQDLLNMREGEQMRVLETIKRVMNEVKLSVVGFGDIRAETAFNVDQHIRARFKTFAIPKWEEGDEFAGFLKALEQHLPLNNRSDLARPEIQKILMKETGGQLDAMLARIKNAAAVAIADGTERITKAMLEVDLPRPPVDVLNER